MMKPDKWPILLGFFLIILLSVPLHAESDQVPIEPSKKLHGKELKEKMASIRIFQGVPAAPYQKLAPIWASKSNMEKTMKDIRKQAARIGADAIINLRVKTEKLHSTSYDPGWWGGPWGWGGGFGPGFGYWGGMSYWGGYAQSHTYTQPVVSGWAVKWKGEPPSEIPELPPKKPTLEQEVEEAPKN